MNQTQMKEMCQKHIDRTIDRMYDLCSEGRVKDASALYFEIRDWILENTEIDLVYLEYIQDILDENK